MIKKDVKNESNKEQSQHSLPNQEPNFTNTSEPLPESPKQVPASQVQHQKGRTNCLHGDTEN